MTTLSKFLLLLGATTFAVGTLSAQATVFSTDLSGAKNWNFDSAVDPNSQIGGTDQFAYAVVAGPASNNGKAYLTKPINGASVFASQTGTLRLSFDLDVSNYTTGSSDYGASNLFSITTTNGNKDPFKGGGSIFNIGVAGFNSPGQYAMNSGAAIVWGEGGFSSAVWDSAGAALYHVVADVTVSGSDGTGWTVTYLTTVTGPGIPVSSTSTSSYNSSDTGFDGLQSISGLEMGYKPFRNNYVSGDVLVIDNVSLSLVPEPGTYAAIMGVLALGVAFIRRRRKA